MEIRSEQQVLTAEQPSRRPPILQSYFIINSSTDPAHVKKGGKFQMAGKTYPDESVVGLSGVEGCCKAGP